MQGFPLRPESALSNPLELRQRCHTFLSGDLPSTPARDFAAMARWCESHGVAHDVYGQDQAVQAFEEKIAALLGYEKAVFCITGTMAQVVALRLAAESRGSRSVALHPSAHVLVHERSNYQLLDHFKVLQVGDPFRTWGTDDLKAWPDRIGAALYELPMREIGGQLPAWEALDELKAYCHAQDIHLHMDGARLWEAAAGYGKTPSEVAQGFDSTYVSLYKGIGGFAGAVLAGSADFIARADMWIKRFGGNVARVSPYVISAAMRFDERLARMPAYLRRAREAARIVGEFPALRVNPAAPQVNMFHVYCPASRERVTAIRNALAEEHGIWLCGAARQAPLADQSSFEWYVGEALLQMPDDRLRDVLKLFVEKL
ncbi:threonine aldolase [Oxalobacteraceae bacterium OM1]|nr:threonine aldolase [Oxalobacteraceae bacterium OM1]